jgi:hypothetical protein
VKWWFICLQRCLNREALPDFVPEEVELDKCLIPKRNMGLLWHRRLAHVDMRNLHKLQKESHILGLTNIVFKKDKPFGACKAKKQVGAPHHTKNIMTTTRPLEMLYMDLFDPIIYISICCNKYGLLIVDDYSEFYFYFDPFLINIREMTPAKTFFQIWPLGATYEGVALVHIA